jgi:hypothetical protein
MKSVPGPGHILGHTGLPPIVTLGTDDSSYHTPMLCWGSADYHIESPQRELKLGHDLF